MQPLHCEGCPGDVAPIVLVNLLPYLAGRLASASLQSTETAEYVIFFYFLFEFQGCDGANLHEGQKKKKDSPCSH